MNSLPEGDKAPVNSLQTAEEAGSGDGEERQPEFSLVILCYRSEERARTFVEQTISVLEEAGLTDYELILVGNYLEGVVDRTPAIVQQLAREHARVRCLTEVKQGWMGWDMRSGLRLARGKFIGVIDGDGQMPVADFPRLYKLMQSGDYDFVKTYRVTRGDSLNRKLLSSIFNKCFRLLFPGLNARDINSKPKIMTRAFYDRLALESDKWFIDAEIMIEARHHKLRIGELPTEFLGLTGRRSFVGWRAILEFVLELPRYRLRESRREKPRR
ncbi:MAG: glycosyltransferase family 2 protein [Planctomycetes bacterium]|nr:glycosyltransferase family 2 protein [Planctomycetota bacterium]